MHRPTLQLAPVFALAAVLFSALSPAAAARPDERRAVLDAMSAELKRTVDQLRLENHLAPYYVGFRLVEMRSVAVTGRFGAITHDDADHIRRVAVDVRVGDYAFDSSPDPDDLGFDDVYAFRPPHDAPIDDDPAVLRGTLWLLADAAYKQALSSHLRKRARKVTEVEQEHVDSFARVKPVESIAPVLSLNADTARWRALVERLSARYRGAKGLLEGGVRISADHVRTYLVTSEGHRMVQERVLYSFGTEAVARAKDGMLLDQGRTYYGRARAHLPDEKALAADVDQVIADLAALAEAPLADPYNGPAILEPEAAGVFFHEAVGHRLEGERQKDDNEGQTFKGQIGARILPDFITVRDDPTLERFGGFALNGFYKYDDEGVLARNVVLVEDGVLKTFLTSRTPVKDARTSNGHGRAQGIQRPVARMANLIVEGRDPVPYDQLKARLLDEVRKQGKPYGLIIRDITGGSTNTSTYGYQAFKGSPRMVYKVDAETGEESLVRGVEIVGTPLTAVSKIMAAADKIGVFNGYCGAESGYVPVSTVAPAMLFREIELQRTERLKERPPVLPAPWAKAQPAGGAQQKGVQKVGKPSKGVSP